MRPVFLAAFAALLLGACAKHPSVQGAQNDIESPRKERPAPLPRSLPLYFGFDSVEVMDSAWASRLAGFMSNDTSLRLVLTGYTDTVGRAGYNDTLSQRRAENTLAAIMAVGTDAMRIEARSRGERSPTADPAKSRRVTAVFKQ